MADFGNGGSDELRKDLSLLLLQHERSLYDGRQFEMATSVGENNQFT